MAQQAFYTKINAGAGVQFSGGTVAQATAVLHTNNVLYLRGGSAGLFLQNSDASEGMFISNSYISLETNSAERLRVDSSGRLLINATTTSFNDQLYVSADAYTTGGWRVGTAATYVGKLINDSGILTLMSDGNRDVRIGNNNNPSILYVDTSAQSVGIGTASPTGVLDVLSTDAQRYARFRAPNGEERFEFHIGSTGNGARLSMFDHDGTTEGVRISASGNSYLNNSSQLGIGTSSPAALLDLTASSAPVFRMYRSGTGQVWTQEIDSSGRWQLREAASSGGTKYTRLQVDDPGNVTFSAYGSGSFTGTAAYNLQVDSSGNIIEGSLTSGTVTGSGTATYLPIWTGSSALGNSIVSSSGGDITINGSDNDPRVYINPLGGDIGDSALIQFNSRGHVGYTGGLIELGDNGQSKDVRLRVNTADLIFQTSNTTRMTVKTDGLVGIGTTSPGTNLDIQGTTAQSLRVKSDDSATIIIDSDGDNSGTSGSYLHYRDTGATKWTLYKETNNDFYLHNIAASKYPIHAKAGGDIILMEDGNKLGVGASTPSRTLHVGGPGGSSGGIMIAPTSGDAEIQFQDSGVTNAYITLDDGTGDMNFRDDSATVLTVDFSNERVGVLNASPQYALDVNGDIATTQYIRHGGDTNTYFGFPGNDIIQFNVNGDEELYIKASGSSANYPDNIVYTDHNFQVGLDGGKHIGNRINYATSQGWVEDAPPTASQAGYYGGNFNLNGASTENQLGWGKNPWDARALIWTSINDSSSNSDGGWNKDISGLPGDDYAYMSIVYVKKNGTETSNTGSFYHGCSGSHTLNLDGNANTNPYFQSTSVNNLPDDVWCVSIGIIQANSDANTTTGGLIGGIYRLDTGQKVQNATTFKMKDGSTSQTHRTYLYYSTNTNNNLSWYGPGFYVVDGTEPTLAELVYALSGTNGSGTANKISKWQDANTLTDSQLSDDGNNVTSTVPIRILDSLAANNPMLTLYNDTNGGGASIWFSDQATSAAQKGYLTFYHSDGASQGGGSTFQFLSTETDMTLQVGGAGKASRIVVWSNNNVNEVDYGFADDVNTGMTRLGADQVGLIAGAVQGVYVTTTAVQLKNAGNTKLATTGGGVDITGALAVGNINMTGALSIDATYPRINLTDTNHDDDWSIINNDGAFGIYNVTDSLYSLSISTSNDITISNKLNIPEQIYHVGDDNTYFGFNANDTWRVVTGGSQRLEINNSGVKIGSGSRVTTILDEDNMASDSATALATQQSIKAYVDNATTGVLTYQGTWNADTNSPTLSSGSGTPGYYYIVSTAGTTDLDGITDWQVGDWAVFSDQATDAWQKIDNTAVGNVSGSGTANKITKWTGSGTIGNSSISDDGSTVTFSGDVVFDSTHDVMWDSSENRLEFWDNAHLSFGDPGGTPDLLIYHDGSNSYIKEQGTGNLYIKASNNFFVESSAGASKIIARTGGAVDLYYNGSKKIETTSAGVTVTGAVSITGDGSNAVTLTESGSGDFTIDASDDIRLDAGGGDIVLRDDGSEYARLTNDSQDLEIKVSTNDKDFKVNGYDNGSEITAFRLDMSDAGWAHFNTGIAVGNASATSTFDGNLAVAQTKKILFDGSGGHTYMSETSDSNLKLFVAGGEVVNFTNDFVQFNDDINPALDSTYNLGTTSVRWANIWVDNINGSTPTTGGPYLPITGGTLTGNLTISNAAPALNLTDTDNSSNIALSSVGGALIVNSTSDQVYQIGGTEYFRIATSGATFAGNITLNSRITFDYGGDHYIEAGTNSLAFKNSSGGSTLTLGFADQAATFYGTVAIPSYIYHKDDPSDDTYFGFSGNDTFVVYTAGGKGIEIDSNRNVDFTGNVYLAGTKKLYLTDDGTNNYIVESSDNVLDFVSAGVVGLQLSGTSANMRSVNFNGNITTETDSTFNIGSTSKRFANIWVDNINGGTPTTGGPYLPLSGGTITGGVTIVDDVGILFGSDGDSFIKHTGAQMSIYNDTGHIYMVNRATDKNIYFQGDNGIGGTTTYFRVDGSGENVQYAKNLLLYDNVNLLIGSGGDLQVYHNGSTSYIRNNTGTLEIRNQTSGASDVFFKTTTSAPSLDTFIILDGSAEQTQFTKDTEHQDSVYAKFGNSGDLTIVHTGSTGYIQNYTGDLQIQSNGTDADILLRSDDGSGGLATYMYLDGGNTRVQFNKDARFVDDKKVMLGTSDDLQIYHDGSNSYIDDAGTGSLFIRASAAINLTNPSGSENIARFIENDRVELYFNGVKEFETTSTGVAVTGNVQFVGAGVGNCGTRYITYNCPDDAEYNVIGLTTGGVDIPGTLDVTGIVTLNNNLRLQDSDKLQLGNSQDMELYHSSGVSYIDNNTGHLYIRNNVDNDDGSNIYIQAKSGENSIICNDDSSVVLYNNNSAKFYTHGSGVGAAGYYGFGSAGTSTGSSYYYRYGSVAAGATQGLIISTSDTGGSYFDGVAQFRNTNTGQGAGMFQMINFGALYGRYINFYRGSTSNIIGYIGYNATNTAVTYSTSSSDIRLKKNIVTWDEEVLPKFLALTPKKFDFKAAVGDKGADKVKGFIAQYEAENFPEVYQLNGNGQDARYGFHPMEMVPYLMKAVKELAEKNKDLERRLAALEK